MKVRSAEVARLAKNPRGVLAALAFGPDAGLVREVAETFLKAVVEDLTDPFRVVDLDESVLNADPARLSDETASISMFGGRRVVRVRAGAGSGAALAAIFKTFLADPKGDAFVVVEAGDLAKSSPLRKLFEEAQTAAAVACYADTPRDVAEVVRSALAEAGLKITPEALADAVSRLGADRGMTRREIEKLILYAHGQSEVRLEDIRAVLGDEAEVRLDEACDAAGTGDLPRLDLAMERLWASEMSPIAVVRAALGHFQRLLQVKTAMAQGSNFDSAARSLRPPIHFSRLVSFRAQVQNWGADALIAALDRLFEAEALCKTTAVPAEAVCGRTLFEVAALGRRRG